MEFPTKNENFLKLANAGQHLFHFSRILKRQGPFPDDILEHGAGDDPPEGGDDGVHLGLVDVVAADGQGDGPAGHRIDDGAEAMLLAAKDQRGVGLREDGDAAVVVDELDQDAHTPALEVAIVGEVAFFQIFRVDQLHAVMDHPDGLREEGFPPDAFLPEDGVVGGDIGQEALVVERDFEQALLADRPGENAHVHFGFPEFVPDGVGEHFLDLQGEGGELIAEVFEETGRQDGRHGGDEGEFQRSRQAFLFRKGHFGDLFHLIENDFRTVDQFAADFRGAERMGVPVEDAYVQFLFQFFDHQAERGLGESAGLGRFPEVPVFVDGDDIMQLLEGHACLLIDFINANIKIFILINAFPGNNFAPSIFLHMDWKAIKVKVTKTKTKLTVPKKTFKKAKKVKKLTATLKDQFGKVIKSKKVTFTVNGKKYTAKTNKKGVATVKVKLSKKKTYKVTVKFAGDKTYYAVKKTGKVVVK